MDGVRDGNQIMIGIVHTSISAKQMMNERIYQYNFWPMLFTMFHIITRSNQGRTIIEVEKAFARLALVAAPRTRHLIGFSKLPPYRYNPANVIIGDLLITTLETTGTRSFF
jgi:hypothetical protein